MQQPLLPRRFGISKQRWKRVKTCGIMAAGSITIVVRPYVGVLGYAPPPPRKILGTIRSNLVQCKGSVAVTSDLY